MTICVTPFIPQVGGLINSKMIVNLVKSGKVGEMEPQKVKIISPDKCQIVNPYSEHLTNSKNTRVVNQIWLEWEAEHKKPPPPRGEDYTHVDALKLELEFQKSVAKWSEKLIRRIANFRFQPKENVFWNNKEVFFESFTYNSAVSLFENNAKWVTKTVPKSDLTKFQLGSIYSVQDELDNGSLFLSQ